LNNLENHGKFNHPELDEAVFKNTKNLFGGRMRLAIVGAAPISKDVLNFLKIAFCHQIVEGYGQTENTGAATITRSDDTNCAGCVGGPMLGVEIKLVDVPEMNYYSTDSPYPRGEVCFKGAIVFSGYYKAPEKTKEALDSEGWLHTGDVAVLLNNGALKIIDRKKNIFKLLQGEYVAAEKCENIFAKSHFVA
jgi:long-chain acyl-CoA synthetase